MSFSSEFRVCNKLGTRCGIRQQFGFLCISHVQGVLVIMCPLINATINNVVVITLLLLGACSLTCKLLYLKGTIWHKNRKYKNPSLSRASSICGKKHFGSKALYQNRDQGNNLASRFPSSGSGSSTYKVLPWTLYYATQMTTFSHRMCIPAPGQRVVLYAR